VLVDMNRIGGLADLEVARSRGGGGVLRIGAMTRQRAAERSPEVAAHAPLLAEALAHVAHPQIRNRGTMGGSVAHADPGAELPAVMLALEASFRLRGPDGERELAARDFFTGLFSTALRPAELLVEIAIPPLPAGAGCAFVEVARRHGDYALAGVGAVVVLDDAGVCREARVAYVNCGPGPLRSANAEAALVGRRLLDGAAAVIEDAAGAGLADLRPRADVHASADYRRHLARVLTGRAVARAAERARASSSTVRSRS
jgi:carbon-monoxide dehydrogenase medium subunit